MDINKSPGLNSIPVYILKNCKTLLSDCLTQIVNLSFISETFPELCRIGKVVPVFKKEDPLFLKNYWPMSVLPIYSKIFEKLIYTRMYNFLEKNELLSDK